MIHRTMETVTFIIVGDTSLQYGAIRVIPLGAVMAIIGLVRTLKALSRK